jgi:hypothetical protein
MKIVVISNDEHCRRLDLDTQATNSSARRLYKLEGLVDPMLGFEKPWGLFA